MSILKLRIIILVALICFVCQASAKITLPAIIASNMVLQQKSNVPLWGNAEANAIVKITTSWNAKGYQTKAAPDGKWQLMIETPEAGGPYAITFSDGIPFTLTDILIGEVWVCSGQSNMEMPMRGFKGIPILNSNDLLTKADNQKLRLFQVQHAVSDTPLTEVSGAWKVSSPESAFTFSAVAFQYGMMLQEILKVPVGIIEADWGGTRIQSWMPENAIARFSAEKPRVAKSKISPYDPSALYNGMIAPIAGFGIQGFLWYQGEANIRQPYNYDQLMKSMVASWRENWKRDTIPFYYVQIAPYKNPNNGDSVPYLREKQQLAQSQIPNVGMIVTTDVGEELNIHPSDKTTISKRLLYWALARTYKKTGIAYQSPVYPEMKVAGDRVTLTFNDTPQCFTTYGREIIGFEVAGLDKVFYPATAKNWSNTIVVSSDKVAKPVAVRYAFKDFGVGNVYNTFGLPVAPFRTDNW